MMEAMKDELKQSIMDHHYEMIKQFFLMQVSFMSQPAVSCLYATLP